VTHFNGELASAEMVDGHAIELSYRASGRAIALLNRTPTRVEIDGAETAVANPLMLPRGQHLVTIE